MAFIFINGNFFEESEAKISVKDRSFRFGDGIFETLSFYDGTLYRWDLHLKRLEEGLKAIKIDYNTDNLKNNILKTIEKNGLTTGVARIAISRGEGSRGYMPTNQKPANTVIEAMARPEMDLPHVSLTVSSYKKIPLECLPVNYKLAQGMNSTLAKMEARDKGYFEALQLNIKNEIAECASGNIFWVKDGTIYTPSLDCGILNGVIRQVLLELSPVKIIEGHFTVDDLKNANEVFITNISWKVLFVSEIESIFKNSAGYKTSEKVKAALEADIHATGK